MSNVFKNLSVDLEKIFDEIREELGFDMSMKHLIANRYLYRQDIAEYLTKANWHLLRAESNDLSYTSQAKEIDRADRIIRILLQKVKAEQGVLETPKRPVSKKKFTPQYVVAHKMESSSPDYEGCRHRESQFSRDGANIEVQVDHISETNFFSNITDEMRRGGLFIATYDILAIGTPLNVRLVLPGNRSFQLKARVAWVREPANCAEDVSPGMGVTFEKLTYEPLEAIQRYMKKRPPIFFEVN